MIVEHKGIAAFNIHADRVQGNDLIKYASQTLSRVQKNPAVKEYIPQDEENYRLRVDAGVMDASRLYLLHPVHIAVKALLRTACDEQ